MCGRQVDVDHRWTRGRAICQAIYRDVEGKCGENLYYRYVEIGWAVNTVNDRSKAAWQCGRRCGRKHLQSPQLVRPRGALLQEGTGPSPQLQVPTEQASELCRNFLSVR